MTLTDLIFKLRFEAEKTNKAPNYLRIAADMIEHLQEERAGLIETNASLQKALFKIGDKLCARQSQLPLPGGEGQCKSCRNFFFCPLDKMAIWKYDFKKCPEYKEAEKK